MCEELLYITKLPLATDIINASITLDVQSIFTPFLQNGTTALLLATQYGHTDLVQLLCESYGADILHRNKVRAMHTASVNRWWGELN